MSAKDARDTGVHGTDRTDTTQLGTEPEWAMRPGKGPAQVRYQFGVSPSWLAGLRRGEPVRLAPGFRHAKSLSDTRMLSCVIQIVY